MADRPDLSILVVNWNTREMTLACLASIYAETHDVPFEVIVVDNGSHDGSANAIAAAFPQARLIAEPVNHGFARANNLAAVEATGEFVLLLNSDTVVLDRAIDRLVMFARANPQAKLWGGRTVFADGSLNIGSAWGRLTGRAAVCYATGLSRLLWRIPWFDPESLRVWDRADEREVAIVSGCFLLIERRFWNELGGFDRAFFMYAEEADLCARARRRGARPRVTPRATIVHHGGGSAVERHATLAALFGGKIRLAAKHLSRGEAAVVRMSYLFAVGSRALIHSAQALVNAEAGARAATWRQLWSKRGVWANPPR